MCAPTQTSSNYGSIGTVRNYSPAKQERFEAEVAKTQQKLQDAGYTPSGHAFDPFGGGPMSAMGEMIWAMKDAKKYPEVQSSSAPPSSINNPQPFGGGGGQRDLKIDSKNNLEASKNKPKKKISGNKRSTKRSTKRGSTGSLRIKSLPNINTEYNSQGGINT